jgi:cytochrome c6
MRIAIRSLALMAAAFGLAGAVCLADTGETTYKAKCAMCHGATGTPSAGMAKMGVKPVSDAEIKKLNADQILAVVKNGKGKMKPVSGLSEADMKAVSAFFHSLK